MRELQYRIPPEREGVCVENYLRHTHGYSAGLLRRLKCGGLLVNEHPIRTVDPLFAGMVLTVRIVEDCDLIPNPSLQAEIIYHDEDLIVYHKPAYMPVHPSLGHPADTLGNLYAATQSGGFHPINRLDANTTGLCLIARHAYAAAQLSSHVEKEYTALVAGQLVHKQGCIDAPIARAGQSIILREVAPHGKRSITHYQVLAENETHSLVLVRLETGRTHQIRVHFAHIGHPLAGDSLYGGDCHEYAHHMLCCTKLIFQHPIHGEPQTFCMNMQNTPFSAL